RSRPWVTKYQYFGTKNLSRAGKPASRCNISSCSNANTSRSFQEATLDISCTFNYFNPAHFICNKHSQPRTLLQEPDRVRRGQPTQPQIHLHQCLDMHLQCLGGPSLVLQRVCRKPFQPLHVRNHHFHRATETFRPARGTRAPGSFCPVPNYSTASSLPGPRPTADRSCPLSIRDWRPRRTGSRCTAGHTPPHRGHRTPAHSCCLVRVPYLVGQVAQIRAPITTITSDRLQIRRAEPRQREAVRPSYRGISLEDHMLEAEEAFAEDGSKGVAGSERGGVADVDRFYSEAARQMGTKRWCSRGRSLSLMELSPVQDESAFQKDIVPAWRQSSIEDSGPLDNVWTISSRGVRSVCSSFRECQSTGEILREVRLVKH
ncbi:hypothetical protein BG003_009374, partial [Podila horticola]